MVFVFEAEGEESTGLFRTLRVGTARGRLSDSPFQGLEHQGGSRERDSLRTHEAATRV